MSENIKRWRGLTALVADMVANGASSVERVHMATARLPFRILEQIPGVSEPALIVDKIYSTAVAGVYSAIRITTRVVAKTVDTVLEAVDDVPALPEEPHDQAR